MQFSSKSWLVAAAFITASATSTAASEYNWTVTSGTAAIAFSFNGLDAVNGLGAAITTNATIPFVRGLPDGGLTNTANYVKPITTINLVLGGGTTSDDALTSAQAANSVVEFRRTILDDSDQIQSYSVFLTHFDIDLASATVYANVYTWDRYKPVVGDFSRAIDFGKLAVFSFDKAGIVGGTQGNITVDGVSASGLATGHATVSSTDSLRLNANVADIFLSGLGLDPATRYEPALQIRLRSWGVLSVNANATGVSAVPEPATWAMMSVGLLGLAAIQRRRRSASSR